MVQYSMEILFLLQTTHPAIQWATAPPSH